MSSAVAELEAGLQGMLTLKAPGVSGSRIAAITTLCIDNVQSESVLVQKLYTHFKKAPATHKLGVLYVVDTVTRKWSEQAKSAGQPIDSTAQDGTFAAGVHRVKELLPVLLNDIIQSAPHDQKEKIRKLLDIWEKGQTFPLQMLSPYKVRLETTLLQNASTTPPGSPPLDRQKSLNLQANAFAQSQAPVSNVAVPSSTSSAPNTLSVLEALANMARQNSTAPTATPVANSNTSQPQNSSYNVSSAQSNSVSHGAALHQGLAFPSVPPPVNAAAPMASQTLWISNAAQNYASSLMPGAGPPPVLPAGGLDPAVQTQLMWIKLLSEQGVPPDKIAAVLAGLPAGGAGAGAGAGPVAGSGAGGIPVLPSRQIQIPNAQSHSHSHSHSQSGTSAWNVSKVESRDRSAFNDRGALRSPPGARQRRRSRSSSPRRGWSARNSPSARRRDDPSHDYDRGSPGRGRVGDRARGRGDTYRQRSPARRGRSPSPQGHGGGQKWIGHDASIPKTSIKVLSRTLFVGGVTMPEWELRNIFDQFGKVQTCIVNKDKRHAFVKMLSREDALSAKDAMEKNRTPDSQLRTRWGVGFGPRECSDYQTGVSVIPINKLTDADRKWMLTAEYGGSGGKPIDGGMVVEEPDIEIGQGVSSKAISRRMQTDKSGHNGPKSGRDYEDDGYRGRREREDRRNERGDGNRNDRAPPSSGPPGASTFQLPGFPFPLPMQNGVPVFPPGFVFPGQPPQQPPPPGHRM